MTLQRKKVFKAVSRRFNKDGDPIEHGDTIKTKIQVRLAGVCIIA